MALFKVSNRYAGALINLSESKGIFENVSNDIELMYSAISGSKEFRVMLASPVIKESVKLSILEELFSSKVSPESMTFIRFIVDKNRENILVDILKRYLELRDIKLGFVNVEITSAVEINSEQEKEIKNKLQEITGKNVRMKFHLNPSIIGGMLIRIGDTIMDSSVAHQLELLKKRFLEESPVIVN